MPWATGANALDAGGSKTELGQRSGESRGNVSTFWGKLGARNIKHGICHHCEKKILIEDLHRCGTVRSSSHSNTVITHYDNLRSRIR